MPIGSNMAGLENPAYRFNKLFYPPTHPSPSRGRVLSTRGEGEGGGDVILFNAFVLVNLRFY
jgi:hypothetical protein